MNVSGRDIWRSEMSEFYYGCSTAGNKFASECLLFLLVVIDLIFR